MELHCCHRVISQWKTFSNAPIWRLAKAAGLRARSKLTSPKLETGWLGLGRYCNALALRMIELGKRSLRRAAHCISVDLTQNRPNGAELLFILMDNRKAQMQLRHLELAERHIIQAEMAVTREIIAIERLRSKGRSTDREEASLEVMQNTLDQFNKHRELVLSELGARQEWPPGLRQPMPRRTA